MTEHGIGGTDAPAQRVLVVEDEPTIARAVADRLTAEGFTVATAADGPAAVDRARAWEPDLIVLDVMLCRASTAWRCAAACRPNVPSRC
ncbi:response regulator [Actinomadura sediminis]